MTIPQQVKKIIFPLLLIIAVTLCKLAFMEVLGKQTPLLLYTGVVVVTTWYSGWAAGLLMSVLSLVVMDYFFLAPYNSFSFAPRLLSHMAIFSLQNILIVAMGYSLNRSLKKAEASENKFKLLIEHACDLLVLRDANGKLLYVSPNVFDIFGYTQIEYMAANPDMLFSELSKTAYNMGLQDIIKKPGGRKTLNIEFVRKDGSKGWLEVDLFNYLEEAGIEALVAHCRDITSRIDLEKQKAGFICVASHELKTPLTSLKAYLQVLELKAKNIEDPFFKTALTKVNQQVSRMTDMINGFLNISRLESGLLELNKVELDINHLVQDAIEDFKITNPNRQLTFIASTNAKVLADRDKVLSVVSNLISNAIKYSKPDTPIILETLVDNRYIQLNVTDKGVGVKANDKPKLFQRYYRVHNEHTKVVSGFGIGLYLSAEIIQLHGGEIGLESEFGKGSTFYVKLPSLTSTNS